MLYPTLLRNVTFCDIRQKKNYKFKLRDFLLYSPKASVFLYRQYNLQWRNTVFGLARSPSLLDLYQTVLQQVELLATSFGTLGSISTSQSKGPDNWHTITLQGYFLNCDTSHNMTLAFGHNVFFWYLRLTLAAITLSTRFCSRDAQPLKLLAALPQTWLCSLNQLLPMAFHWKDILTERSPAKYLSTHKLVCHSTSGCLWWMTFRFGGNTINKWNN